MYATFFMVNLPYTFVFVFCSSGERSELPDQSVLQVAEVLKKKTITLSQLLVFNVLVFYIIIILYQSYLLHGINVYYIYMFRLHWWARNSIEIIYIYIYITFNLHFI